MTGWRGCIIRLEPYGCFELIADRKCQYPCGKNGVDTTTRDRKVDMPSAAVGQLKNIGPTVARRLNEVGIRTRGELERAGSVAAYCEIKQRNPEARTPLCYYLYSLEGALRDQHWDDIGEESKVSLRNKAARFLNERR